MDDGKFWDVLQRAGGDADKVEKELLTWPAAEIADWQRTYWDKHNALHNWDVWGAAYVISGGCGDDGFHYFKAWAIGKGRECYETALNSPDSLGGFVTDTDLNSGCDNELLNYAADKAHEGVTGGQELPYTSIEGTDPGGEEWDEVSVYERFPNLTARFG